LADLKNYVEVLGAFYVHLVVMAWTHPNIIKIKEKAFSFSVMVVVATTFSS